MDSNPKRTGLAGRWIELLMVGIPLLTAIIELVSKVVNYACPVRKFRIQLYQGR